MNDDDTKPAWTGFPRNALNRPWTGFHRNRATNQLHATSAVSAKAGLTEPSRRDLSSTGKINSLFPARATPEEPIAKIHDGQTKRGRPPSTRQKSGNPRHLLKENIETAKKVQRHLASKQIAHQAGISVRKYERVLAHDDPTTETEAIIIAQACIALLKCDVSEEAFRTVRLAPQQLRGR